MNEKKFHILFFLSIAVLTVVMRLVPHPPNFAAVGALALISGTYLSGVWRFVAPLGVMFLSDLFIGFYNPTIALSVYGSFALIAYIGHRTQKSHALSTKLISAFFASWIFFLVTNAAVWYFSPLYPETLSGLLLSYTAAIPFFRNTLVSTLLYTSVFFGAYSFVRNYLLIKHFIPAVSLELGTSPPIEVPVRNLYYNSNTRNK